MPANRKVVSIKCSENCWTCGGEGQLRMPIIGETQCETCGGTGRMIIDYAPELFPGAIRLADEGERIMLAHGGPKGGFHTTVDYERYKHRTFWKVEHEQTEDGGWRLMGTLKRPEK